jgi:hypothetical protein
MNYATTLKACLRLAELWQGVTPTRAADLAIATGWLEKGCKAGAVSACHKLADAAIERLQYGGGGSSGGGGGGGGGGSDGLLSAAIGWLQVAARYGDDQAVSMLQQLLPNSRDKVTAARSGNSAISEREEAASPRTEL